MLELIEGTRLHVGTRRVHRLLPCPGHQTVGAWCLADHLVPAPVTDLRDIRVSPHPHVGLQTVTWLVAGEILHRDSLGSEQILRPGQLHVMTAGRGVTHAEEPTGRARGELHGLQLWAAQPDTSRNGPPSFRHFDEAQLPKVDVEGGTATVLIGSFAGAASPAPTETQSCVVDLVLHGGTTTVPTRPECEYAIVILDGDVESDGCLLTPGHLAYIGTDHSDVSLHASTGARAVLLGGVPFPEPLVMAWNFAVRSNAEAAMACESWRLGDRRFGVVNSSLPRIPSPSSGLNPARGSEGEDWSIALGP